MKNQNNKTEQLKELLYQETQIHFLINPKDKNVMVNATEMAKVFGKRTGHFLANKDTKDTILALERTLNSVRSEDKNQFERTGIPVNLEDKNQSERTEMSVHSDMKILDDRGHMGMYFHRLLAIDFASWLDKDFKVWMLRSIDDLMFGVLDRRLSILETAEQESDEKEELLAKIEESPEYLRIKEIESNKRKRVKALKKWDNDLLAGQIPLDI